MKKKPKIDLSRPDKILLSGLKTITNLAQNLYAEEKRAAKGSGQVTFIGKKKVQEVSAQLFSYNYNELTNDENVIDFKFLDNLEKKQTHWLNTYGLHEVDLIKSIGSILKLDRATQIQTLDTTLRPKVEEYEHYLFFSVKSILKVQGEELKVEQLSFVLGDNYVISFQEEHGDHFNHIRNKIVEKLGLVRKKGADFLLYQLLDAILDNYFETIERININVSSLENDVLVNPSQKDLVRLEQIKQQSEMVKKSLNPFKEALRVISNRETVFIKPENKKFYNDLVNSCLGAIEEVESTIRSLDGLTNIYFSSLSQKMNETMKVLTTVATIFIPLTFIAGIYGMNFDNMPELHHPNGYFYIWGVMGAVFLAMIAYFKRKKWL